MEFMYVKTDIVTEKADRVAWCSVIVFENITTKVEVSTCAHWGGGGGGAAGVDWLNFVSQW